MSPVAAVEEETTPGFAGKHFTPAGIGAAWGLSADTVRRLFEREPGVLVIEPPRGRFSRRRYRTLRIPAAVVERVHRRLSVVTRRP
jgi:hypothetical protein